MCVCARVRVRARARVRACAQVPIQRHHQISFPKFQVFAYGCSRAMRFMFFCRWAYFAPVSKFRTWSEMWSNVVEPVCTALRESSSLRPPSRPVPAPRLPGPSLVIPELLCVCVCLSGDNNTRYHPCGCRSCRPFYFPILKARTVFSGKAPALAGFFSLNLPES